MERPQRLIAMLVALQANRQMTAAELSQQFEVSKRTILRDIDALIDADVPVVAERGRYGGIRLVPGADIDVNRLTGAETDVLSLVGIDLRRARQLGLEVATRSAAQKLASRRSLPPLKYDDSLLSVGEVVAIDASRWFAPDETPELADLVSELRRGRRLTINYRSSGACTSREYTVDPYGLFARGGRWYLIADIDGVPRMFATARMVTWRGHDEARKIRSNVTLAEVAESLVRNLEQRHGLTIEALLDVGSVDLARRILGSRLLSVGASNDPDKVKIAVGYSEVGGVRHLLQFGDHIEIIAPAEAREVVREQAEHLAATHRPKGQGML